jgi:hypothetical protein
MPLIQACPLKIKETDFQKRKTCRTGEDCPAQMGFEVKGLFRIPTGSSFIRHTSGKFENANKVGSEIFSNSV